MTAPTLDIPVFDADNHLYETRDSLTKFLPDRYKGAIDHVEVRGRTKIVVLGQISEYIPNPTFEVVARPGAQEEYYRRGNPQGRSMREIFGKPMRALPAWTFEYERRIFTTPVITMPIVEKAIEELEWVVERGARVVLVRPAPAWGIKGPRSFGLPEYDPFWAKVVEHDVLVAMHSSDSGYERHTNEWIGNDTEMLPQDFAEDPVTAIKRNIYISPFWEEGLGALAQLVGADHVLFGSDYPHPEGLASPASYVDELRGVPEADVSKIMGGNLARLMSVDDTVLR